jgi:signal recognition particle subunit SRP54
MFNNLSQRLTGVFDKLRGRGVIGEAELSEALREIRIALLEADVALPVVRTFIEQVKERALGHEVVRSISPAQMVVKIVHDCLVNTFGEEPAPLNLNTPAPAVIMMAGLQGSGKTTSAAKLALYLKNTLKKKVLLTSVDIYRPAAQKQLAILGQSIGVDAVTIIEGEEPKAICERSLKEARLGAYDVLILDTAGRLHIDDAMMDEVQTLHKIASPIETFFVADAMGGQDAVRAAQGFKEKLPLTGVILTRVDGDSRGGAALSVRAITGCPIKFMGVGEKPEQFEVFDPARLADRILDRGDIVTLVERASALMEQEDAEKLANRAKKGHFDLNDMASHLQQMLKLGGLSSIVGMLPGASRINDKLGQAGVDDRMIKRQVAIIQSMTPGERRDRKILNASRKRRVAAGCGLSVMEVNRLLKQFEQMQKMMKHVSKMGAKGFLRGGLSSLLGQ